MTKRRTVRGKALAAAFAAALAIPVMLNSGAQATTGDGSPGDPNIQFVGRRDTSTPSAVVPNWAGAYLETGFTGTTVKLKQRRTIDLYYSIDKGAFAYIRNVSGTVDLTPTALAPGRHTLTVS